ncbi:hypothetical protein E4U54_008689 [Claviceps lovelessii]|nr:hypothetical protein E4U54_008689 [Claviceps lovelessii]
MSIRAESKGANHVMAGGPAIASWFGSSAGDKAAQGNFLKAARIELSSLHIACPVIVKSISRPVSVLRSPSPQRIAIEYCHTTGMAAPKRIYGEKPRRAPKGYFASAYGILTSPDNAAVVRSIAMFGAAVTFLASPWGELLLPPYAITPQVPSFMPYVGARPY